ncbi:MAG TPA: hypothetical protein VJI71_01370 [Candidatus Norongarragalinales archaeon]|nr:hypothetical protein [Candidatus Norongarragalinales archaeon]
MKQYAFLFDSKDVQALKKILEADPYSDGSFARIGYVLKESAAAGLKTGKYVVFFKAEETMGKMLSEKLKVIPSFSEATSEELSKINAVIEKEENAATEGFGSIFG